MGVKPGAMLGIVLRTEAAQECDHYLEEDWAKANAEKQPVMIYGYPQAHPIFGISVL